MLSITAALFAAVGATTPYQKEWLEFKANFGKAYNGDKEEAVRFSIFKENLDYITSTNAKNLTFTLGVGPFADLKVEEFLAEFTGAQKPSSLYMGVQHLGEHDTASLLTPSAVDWTTKGVVTPVKNQGHCGSCWSFSTTGALEGAYGVATGKLVSLSEQQFVDCSGQGGCSGGWPYEAFEWVESQAVCTETSYPYHAVQSSCRSSSCTPGIQRGDVTGYKTVSKSVDGLMSAVAQQPVSITVQAGGDMQHYRSGVLMGYCSGQINHAVLAVGYGTESSQDYWKVKNSWGESWGDHGYFLLERGAGGDGAYCVLQDSPSYPVVSSTAHVVV